MPPQASLLTLQPLCEHRMLDQLSCLYYSFAQPIALLSLILLLPVCFFIFQALVQEEEKSPAGRSYDGWLNERVKEFQHAWWKRDPKRHEVLAWSFRTRCLFIWFCLGLDALVLWEVAWGSISPAQVLSTVQRSNLFEKVSYDTGQVVQALHDATSVGYAGTFAYLLVCFYLFYRLAPKFGQWLRVRLPEPPPGDPPKNHPSAPNLNKNTTEDQATGLAPATWTLDEGYSGHNQISFFESKGGIPQPKSLGEHWTCPSDHFCVGKGGLKMFAAKCKDLQGDLAEPLHHIYREDGIFYMNGRIGKTHYKRKNVRLVVADRRAPPVSLTSGDHIQFEFAQYIFELGEQ